MAFNPDPKVDDARTLARKWQKTKVIIIMVDDRKGTIEYASYGENAKACDRAKDLAYLAFNAILNYLGGH